MKQKTSIFGKIMVFFQAKNVNTIFEQKFNVLFRFACVKIFSFAHKVSQYQKIITKNARYLNLFLLKMKLLKSD